jgi:hypothetical protein
MHDVWKGDVISASHPSQQVLSQLASVGLGHSGTLLLQADQ